MVASQVRGYGVWDGALAQGGTLLAACEGCAPSLLFLWVSEAQANLLRAELCPIQASAATSGTVGLYPVTLSHVVWSFYLNHFPLTPCGGPWQARHAASCCWCSRSSCGSSGPPCWPPSWTWTSTGRAITLPAEAPGPRSSGATACCSSTPAQPPWTVTCLACWDNSRSALFSRPSRFLLPHALSARCRQ